MKKLLLITFTAFGLIGSLNANIFDDAARKAQDLATSAANAAEDAAASVADQAVHVGSDAAVNLTGVATVEKVPFVGSKIEGLEDSITDAAAGAASDMVHKGAVVVRKPGEHLRIIRPR